MRIFVLLSFLLFCSSVVCAENVKELTLDEAFQLALQNHEEIKIYDLEVKRTGFDTKIVIGNYLPQISASASKNYLDSSVPITSPNKTQEAHITLSQKVVDISLFSAYKGSRTVLSKAKNDLQNIIQRVLFDVAEVYFGFFRSHKLVEVDKENLKIAERQYNVVEKRFEAGEVPKTDFLSIKSEKMQLKSVLATHRADLISNREALSNLLGLKNIDRFVRLNSGSVQEFKFIDLFLDDKYKLKDLIDMAMKNRFDLKSLLNQIETLNWEIKSLATTNLPTVSANFDKGWISPRGTRYRKNSHWTASLNLEMPLFEGMQNYFKIKEAKNRLAQVNLEEERLVKDIRLQVTKAWWDIKASTSSLQALSHKVTYDDERYKAISLRYDHGLVSDFELMESLRNLFRSKIELVNKQYDHKINMLKLDKQVGKLGILVEK